MLRDPIATSAVYADQTGEQVAELIGAGFEVAFAEDLISHNDQNVAAELRFAIGVNPFKSEQAREAIRGWISDCQDFDACVWIGRNDAGSAESWLIVDEDMEPEVVKAAALALAGTHMRSASREPSMRSGRD
jgi:hypothetical protein